jgi:hypothetical protein
MQRTATSRVLASSWLARFRAGDPDAGIAIRKELDMTHARQMLDTYPRSFNVDAQPLAAGIEACFDCAQTCTACADACLSEENVAELAKCIRRCLDCAEVCAATGKVLSRQTEYDANLTKTLL